MRRQYKEVSVAADPHGYAVLLDGKPLKTPALNALVLPTEKMAQAIAGEWRAQEKTVKPASMPMMQFAATALDHTGAKRSDVIERLTAYLGSELLCHRVTDPEPLAKRQDELWNPPLDWLKRRYDVTLHTTDSVTAVAQPPATLQRLEAALQSLNPWQLIGVQTAILTSGSFVLGLALFEGEMDAASVFAASELESTYQIEVWGEDAELVQRREGILAELISTACWLELLD